MHLAANKPLSMTLVDLEKGFDPDPRDFIWKALHKQGIDAWLMPLVQPTYKDVRSRISVGDNYSKEFGVRVGVHQGSVLSPLLSSIMLPRSVQLVPHSLHGSRCKLKTLKSNLKKKGLWKTKIMVSGINLDLVKQSGKDPCASIR